MRTNFSLKIVLGFKIWHPDAGSLAADARWGEGDEELSYGDAWEDDPFPGEATAGAASAQLPSSCRPSAMREAVLMQEHVIGLPTARSFCHVGQ